MYKATQVMKLINDSHMILDQNDFSEFQKHVDTISAFNLLLLSSSYSLKTNKN